MAVIATLLPNANQQKRVRLAVRDRHEIVACDDWDALIRVCERSLVRLAIVDLFARGKASFEQVRQLKQRLPRLTVIAYVAFAPDRAHDIFDAGRQGMNGLVIVDQDDSPRGLQLLVEQSEARSLSAVVAQSLTSIEPMVRDATLLAVTRAHERISPQDLARLLGVPRRTVSQRLAKAGFPPPQRLLTWGRLVVAAHLLEDRHRSADRIAALLDFPSGSAFRNSCQRYLHAAPHEIRARGGAAYVIRTMLRQTGVNRVAPTPRATKRRLALAI